MTLSRKSVITESVSSSRASFYVWMKEFPDRTGLVGNGYSVTFLTTL